MEREEARLVAGAIREVVRLPTNPMKSGRRRGKVRVRRR